MAQRSFRGLLIGLALVGLCADQASKYGVFRWLYNDGTGGAREVATGYFRLLAQFEPGVDAGDSVLRNWSGPVMPRVNHGALFGLGGEYAAYANGFFMVVSILAAVAITIWAARRQTARDPALCAALGLILGGTLGNLYDRVVFGGVRDFLHFYWIEWPVFNVADCCLVCGAGLLLFQAFFTPATAEDKLPAATAGAAVPAAAK
jgi:lipoprotein signal peptidase